MKFTTTVYSKPKCSQCDATYRALDKRGIEYSIVDITQDHDAMARIVSLGAQSAPVVEVEYEDGTTSVWWGFDPAQIAALSV